MQDAARPSRDSPNTSRRFLLGAREVLLVAENPTCSIPALKGFGGLWLFDVGTRGSLAIRLRPYMKMSTPPPPRHYNKMITPAPAVALSAHKNTTRFLTCSARSSENGVQSLVQVLPRQRRWQGKHSSLEAEQGDGRLAFSILCARGSTTRRTAVAAEGIARHTAGGYPRWVCLE